MLGSSPGNPAAAAWAANLLCPGTLEAALVQQSHTIKIIRSSHLGIKVSGYCPLQVTAGGRIVHLEEAECYGLLCILGTEYSSGMRRFLDSTQAVDDPHFKRGMFQGERRKTELRF